MTLSLFSMKINLLPWKRIIICLWLHFVVCCCLITHLTYSDTDCNSRSKYTLENGIHCNLSRNFGKLSLNVISFHKLSLGKRALCVQQRNNCQFKHCSWVFFSQLKWFYNFFHRIFVSVCELVFMGEWLQKCFFTFPDSQYCSMFLIFIFGTS